MTTKEKQPIRTLTIYLAKPDSTEATLIDTKKARSKTPIFAQKKRIGTLYSSPARPHVPSWVAFFGEAVDAKALGLLSSSSAAALVTNVKGKRFVTTFGYGRHFVNQAAVEESFGLRVTLNSVEDGGIRTIDRKTFEGVTTHTREQASKEGSFADFGIDTERDLLRAVVGTPADSRLGRRLAGMDALSASCRVDLTTLNALLASYEAKAREATYREKHPWIDNITELREPSLIEALDMRLVDELKGREIDRKCWRFRT